MTINIRNEKAIKQKPSAILFDLDNTFYHYDKSHIKAITAVKNKTTRLIGLTEDEFDTAYLQARNEVKDCLNGTASSHSRLLYFQRLLEIVGMRSQALISLDLEQTYWQTFLSQTQLFPGAVECLQTLKSMGMPTAIVSDLTTQIQLRKLIFFKLDSYFDYIVTSEEVGIEKPDSKPFKRAIEKLNLNDDNVWMVGDNPVTDMQGAKQHLNCVTLQKNHSGVKLADGEYAADIVFENFSELDELLGKL